MPTSEPLTEGISHNKARACHQSIVRVADRKVIGVLCPGMVLRYRAPFLVGPGNDEQRFASHDRENPFRRTTHFTCASAFPRRSCKPCPLPPRRCRACQAQTPERATKYSMEKAQPWSRASPSTRHRATLVDQEEPSISLPALRGSPLVADSVGPGTNCRQFSCIWSNTRAAQMHRRGRRPITPHRAFVGRGIWEGGGGGVGDENAIGVQSVGHGRKSL